jgi:hypothetical protein
MAERPEQQPPRGRIYIIPPGTTSRACRACNQPIWFVGKMPCNQDGTPHWGTCSAPEQFRRKRAGKRARRPGASRG